MALEDEIPNQRDETYMVLSFFRRERSRYNSSRDFLTDLVNSHKDDDDEYREEDEFDEVVNAFRREIDDRFPSSPLEPPFDGWLICAWHNVDWTLVARYMLLELALDNLRSPSKESTGTSSANVELEKEPNS
jgi:hypothetical protein